MSSVWDVRAIDAGDPPVDSRGTTRIRVVVRVRPLNDRERDRHGSNSNTCIDITGASETSLSSTPHKPVDNSPVLEATDMNLLESPSRVSNASQEKSNRLENTVRSPSIGSKIPRLCGKIQSKIPSVSPKRKNSFTISQPQSSVSLHKEKEPIFYRTLTLRDREFDFDAVFSPLASQSDVYRGSVGDALKQNTLSGYHTTIMAYGQTGSGKTFTMMNEDGIVARSIDDLMDVRDLFQEEYPEGSITITLTCVELCLENFRDLLVEDDSSQSRLTLRGDGNGAFIEGATTIAIENREDALAWIQEAAKQRVTCATLMNEQSSRSHAVYSFRVEMQSSKQCPVTMARVTLVDLAGSERIKQTGVVGSQQKESININKDLFVLGKVMKLLSERSDQQSPVHIPYRDSKLTRLLQDSLGGNCCTLLIACVSPSTMHEQESLNTLRYAERSRKITNLVRKNELDKAVLLTVEEANAIKTENQQLKLLVEELRQQIIKHQSPRKTLPRIGSSFLQAPSQRLLDLQDRIQRAKQEAQEVRSNSMLVMERAGKWKSRLDEDKSNMPQKKVEATETLTDHDEVDISDRLKDKELTGEECKMEKRIASEGDDPIANPHDPTDDQLSCENNCEPPEAVNVLDSELYENQSVLTTHGLYVETEQGFQNNTVVLTPKDALVEELMSLSDQVDMKRFELKEIELSCSRREIVAQEVKEAERYRDELNEEVDHLKLKIHLLTTGMSNDTKDGGLLSIFRAYSGESYEEDDLPGDVEMKSLSSRPQNDETSQQFATLQQELEAERLRCRVLAESNKVLKERLQKVEEENLGGVAQENCLGKAKEGNAQYDLQTRLEEEILRLQEENDALKAALVDRPGAKGTRSCDENNGETTQCGYIADDGISTSSTHDDIRSQAEKMLSLADKAIERYKGSERRHGSNSTVESGTLNLQEHSRATAAPAKSETMIICNISEIEGKRPTCNCNATEFFGKAEYVDFYLPKITVNCMSCGKRNGLELSDGGDPSSIRNILKQWQIDFLTSVNLHNTLDFIHACNQRRGILARQLKHWRKAKKMTAMRTDSCAIALHVWSSTCKSVIKAVSEQKQNGATDLVRPDFMQVQLLAKEHGASLKENTGYSESDIVASMQDAKANK